MRKTALITGITGQDGSYLAELLLSKDYKVHGVVRRISQPNLSNLAGITDSGEHHRLTLHTGDMTDGASLFRIIEEVIPDEIYNLAAMSQVRDSYDHPEVTQDINAGGLLRIMEACRAIGYRTDWHPKIYQACSSEMFGLVQETPQNEKTPFHPRSPYGASKVAAYNLARVWRQAYGTQVYCGILFNHESPRRGEAFLSRKACKAVAEIAVGKRKKLTLGWLEATRDWGYAPEYVEWIYRILQHDTPDDFVIATGESHSVREFVELAFRRIGIDDWKKYVDYDQNLERPAEVHELCGDASKSKRVLGFEPKIKFGELVQIMLDAELEKLRDPPAGTFTHEDARRTLESFPDAKLITAKTDTVLGRHLHRKKEERFVLCSGSARMFVGGSPPAARHIQMKIGHVYTIPPGVYHEFHMKAGSVLIGLNSRPYDPSDDHGEWLKEEAAV